MHPKVSPQKGRYSRYSFLAGHLMSIIKLGMSVLHGFPAQLLKGASDLLAELRKRLFFAKIYNAHSLLGIFYLNKFHKSII